MKFSTLQHVWSFISGSSTASHPRYVMSCIGCRFNNVSNISCAHWCSTVCTASHPFTCRPWANQSLENLGRHCLRSAAHGDLAVPATRTVHYGPCDLCCGWTVYMELLANITPQPVINTDILLSPTEDLSLQQSTCFISTLVTVTFLLERVNNAEYNYTIHTYKWEGRDKIWPQWQNHTEYATVGLVCQ